jgi:aryl-alcohol dehydrogenase-like predicted oxidoreductase
MTAAALPTAPFGRTGHEVTQLGFGAMELRRGDLDAAAVTTLLHQVLDLGINLIDTSPDYGASEARIGEALGSRRDEYFLASKCGCPIGKPKVDGRTPPHDYTRGNVRAGIEQSLDRLRTDHLDLVQLHGNPSRSVLEQDDTIAELIAARDAGLVRFVGISGQLPDLRDHLAMGVFDAFQIPYSAVERDHEDVLADAARSGAATIVRGAVARGTRSEREDRSPDTLRGVVQEGLRRWDDHDVDELLDGQSATAFLLRFTISNPDAQCAIVGTADPSHLAENVAAAARGPLPPDVYDDARRRLAVPTREAAAGHTAGTEAGATGRGLRARLRSVRRRT